MSITVRHPSPRMTPVQLDNGTAIPGQRFVIATGSHPADSRGCRASASRDSWTAFQFGRMTKLPESVTILGNDPTGLEFAQGPWARWGTAVTLLTDARGSCLRKIQTSALLDRPAIVSGPRALTIGTGSGSQPGWGPGEVESGFAGPSRIRRPAVGARLPRRLCSSPRAGMPMLRDSASEAVGIHGERRNGIAVDDYLQTHAPRVYAIGDVLLKHAYAHVAEREAAVAFQNAVLRIKKKIDYSIMPRRDLHGSRGCVSRHRRGPGPHRRAGLIASIRCPMAISPVLGSMAAPRVSLKVVTTPAGQIRSWGRPWSARARAL